MLFMVGISATLWRN